MYQLIFPATSSLDEQPARLKTIGTIYKSISTSHFLLNPNSINLKSKGLNVNATPNDF